MGERRIDTEGAEWQHESTRYAIPLCDPCVSRFSTIRGSALKNSNSQVWFGQIWFVAVSVGLFGLAGCGGGSSSSVTPPQTTYSVGGTVSGLTGTGLTLQNNGGDTLSVTGGTFTFATKLPSGGSYDVTISAQPSGQTCTSSGNSGTVGSANVTTVLITCTTLTGTVSISNSPCAQSAEPPCPIGVGANWQYTASVSGATNQAVTWSVSASGGTIDASTGLYIAPLAIPSPAKVTITATSQANPTQSASTSVTVQSTDPIGTVSMTPLNSCAGSLQNATCYQLTVSCPGVADITAYLKVNNPNAAPVGTVLFGVGTGGSGLYDDPNAAGFMMGSTVVQNVLVGGFNTVQVSFGAPFTTSQPNGWLQGPGGVRRLACRYATIADWVYHNPKTINPNPNNNATNSAPMCATANSGGSGAIAYAVYEYGLGDTEFAMIEPTSGPPMTRIDQGCSPCNSNVQGPVCASSMNHPNLCYEPADAAIIDEAYQSAGASSPTLCTSALNGNTAPNGLFLSDSILYNGNISLPNTSVKMLFGDLDTSNAVPQGMVWGQSVSPSPALQCIADAGHPIPDVNDGAMQIATDIQQNCH
jgi:hypothetical protein